MIVVSVLLGWSEADDGICVSVLESSVLAAVIDFIEYPNMAKTVAKNISSDALIPVKSENKRLKRTLSIVIDVDSSVASFASLSETDSLKFLFFDEAIRWRYEINRKRYLQELTSNAG